MDRKEKLAVLRKLNEKELTETFLIPLFQEMGFRNVKYNHGVLEYGKDVIYCEETKFHKLKHAGVQVKQGDINTAIAEKIFSQITEGMSSFTDLSDNNKEKPIDEFLVVTSGVIKEYAREKLSKKLENVHISKPLSFIEGNELVELLEGYMPSAFWDEYDYFTKYFNALKTDFERITDISAIGRQEPVPLEKIYVSLRMVEPERLKYTVVQRGFMKAISDKFAEISDDTKTKFYEYGRYPLPKGKEVFVEEGKKLVSLQFSSYT